MLFNSLDFALFLPLVFSVYWLVNRKKLRLQNFIVVLASYFFYGLWDWRFLSLIFVSTLIDYCVGIFLSKNESEIKRKLMLWVSIIFNLGFLGVFKYYNFFVNSFVETFSFLGFKIQANTLDIILPVGISFYTFQTLSYSIDVYRRKLEATRDFIAFAAYVSFFPQLVAGPIERASNLLPQFYKKRYFNYELAINGLRQILWGFFKKIVIADNCAKYADQIFNNSGDYSGSTLFLGAFFFTFQIYGDFSGYSDIAIGTSRLFGFDLKRNFAYPYFSRDVAEFWRRWHISLSTWFRDYVYIPIGGSKGGLIIKVRNTFIIFLVSGFWHGANWTFIAWGMLNAIYFLPLLLSGNNRNNIEIVGSESSLPNIRELGQICFTFILVLVAWIFFRAETLNHAVEYISELFSMSFFSLPEILPLTLLSLIAFFVLIEWLGRKGEFALDTIGLNWKRPLRWGGYICLILLIFYSGNFKGSTFIYFQF